MSLILDALKQAEHERGRDRAPELFGPAMDMASALPTASPAPRWPWVLAATAVLVAAGALIWTYGPSTPAVSQAPPTAASQLPPSPPAGTALFVPPAAEPAPASPSTDASMAASQPATPVTAVPPLRPAPPPTMVASPVQTPAEATPPAATELPAEVRARLPGLNITGHTYSDNPTLRMLMIDGRMFVEGQAVQPGLRVERIGPHRAVFNHQGTRFAVDY